MTNKQNKEYSIKEWLLRAQDDELSSKAVLNCKQGAPATVCFLSQQMAENAFQKAMKIKDFVLSKIHG